MNNNHATLPSPPWAVRAWPPLLWQLGKNNLLPMQHLCTQVNPSGDPAFRSMGQTLWGARCSDGQAALAWDWVELCEGVFAMADPMGIVTNLRLLDDSGEVLPAVETARQMNVIVHGLPWQQAVEQAVVHPAHQPAAHGAWFKPRAASNPSSARLARSASAH